MFDTQQLESAAAGIPEGGISGGPVGLVVGVVSAVANLLASIINLFGGGNQGVNPATVAMIQQAAFVAAQATDDVMRSHWSLMNAIAKLLAAISGAITGIVKPAWDKTKDSRQAHQNVVQKILTGILRAIRTAQAILRDIYQRFIRPVLIVLQQIRRILFILRLFHVKFAAQLDGILGRIQSKFIAPYLYVLRTINGIGNWVNLVITARGVIQRPVFLNSMYAYQRQWVNMWWSGQQSQSGAGSGLSLPATPAPLTQQQVTLDFSAFVTADSGPYAAIAARAQQAAEAAG